MTGSPTTKSSGDPSPPQSSTGQKVQEQSKPIATATSAFKLKPKTVNAKESTPASKDAPAHDQNGLLDVVDEDSEDALASCASPKFDREENVSLRSPKRSVTDASEEATLRIHTEDSDHVKVDENLGEGGSKPEKGDVKEAAKPAVTRPVSVKSKPADKSGIKNKILWVYNILPSTKASELKIHFSKYANITMARVVTNGKKYYGCLTVENEESVKECIQQLNKTIIDGQEIRVQSNAPENDKDSTEDQQKCAVPNANKKLPAAEQRGTPEGNSRPLKKPDRKTDNPDPLTRVVKSPKKVRSISKEAPPDRPHPKRRRSRSNSIERETRQKVLELRRLTADVEDLQRRKERLIADEKERERERRENDRIQEMRRKIEEERAQKRMEIELAKKKLEFERNLLEKEREAFTKLKAIEMEEMRIRCETKRKIEEAEEYQRQMTRKVSSKERKRSSSPLKRYHQQQGYDGSSKRRGSRGADRSRSPNLYLSSQTFDIKPLKRENDDKYGPVPKIASSPTNCSQRNSAGNSKSSSNHNNRAFYNPKENRYNNSSRNKSPQINGKGPNKPSQQHLSSSFGQAKLSNANSTWLPSTLSATSSTGYRPPLMSDHRNGGAINIPWQQISNSASGGGIGKMGGRYEQQQQQYHHGGMRHHQAQYAPQMMDGGAGAPGKDAGCGRGQGGYQGGRRY